MKEIKPFSNKNNRVFYFDFLRAIACISVIIIHISSNSLYEYPLKTPDWFTSLFVNSMSHWSVPIFFMISGALLLGIQKITIDKLYKKYILRFCTVIIFWSVVYATFKFLSTGNLKSSINRLIGGEYHMWFMFSIIALYILSPILKSFINNEKTLLYALTVFFFFPFVLHILDLALTFNLPHTQHIILQLKNLINKFEILPHTEYIFYFLLGHYLHSTVLTKKAENRLIISGIISLLFTLIANGLFSWYLNQSFSIFSSHASINGLLLAVGIFVAAKKYISLDKIPLIVQNIVLTISKYSFGIYLSHILILSLVGSAGLTTSILPSILFIPIATIVVLLGSIFTSFLLSHIPFLKKWIV